MQTNIEVLGERPAGRCAQDNPLVRLAVRSLRSVGYEPEFTASSTDANIPLSLGIPAVCIGVTHTERAHTLDEWLAIPSIPAGLAQPLRLCIETCALIANGAAIL